MNRQNENETKRMIELIDFLFYLDFLFPLFGYVFLCKNAKMIANKHTHA